MEDCNVHIAKGSFRLACAGRVLPFPRQRSIPATGRATTGKGAFLDRGDRECIFAEGDHAFSHHCIIAGGSVRAEYQINNSIVIAGGSISSHLAVDSILISNGSISYDRAALRCLLLTNADLVRRWRSGKVLESVVKEKQKDHLLGVRFFNLEGMGLQVKEIPFGLRAERINNKALEACGLEAGDVIVDVEGTKIRSEDSLKAAIYSRLGNRSFRLKVLRGKESRTLTINVLDFAREMK